MSEEMSEITVLDIFHQAAEPDVGIPSTWCVQYQASGVQFVNYAYFDSHAEAFEWARAHER